jgi:hypothetical protein
MCSFDRPCRSGLIYARLMARGWESKSIEAQQEEKERAVAKAPPASAEQLAAADQRRTVELARRRALDDLSRATVPAHRAMLEKALQALDERLRDLGRA